MPITALNIIGPYKGVSGYDHHVRAFVTQLLKLGVDVHLDDLEAWSETKLPIDLLPKWSGTLEKKVVSDIYLYFCMPHQMQIQAEGIHVLFTMFEADRIPISWVEPSLKSDMLILPTKSSIASWKFRGVPESKMHLCPLGVDSELFMQNWPPLHVVDKHEKLLSDYSFRFLNISELRPRKNLLSLIRVWMNATTTKDDAVLILKIGGLQDGFFETFMSDLKVMQDSFGIDERNYAPIHFIHEVMPWESMVRLYRTASYYISLSHGEGWDMPMMEAGASGLTLIAPNHSAYPTYLNKENAYLIPSEKVPVRFDGNLGKEDLVFFHETNWWKPDEDKASEIINNIIDGTIPDVESPRSLFLENYSWEKATLKLIKILESHFGN